MLDTANVEDSYKVKTMTEASPDEDEEGDFDKEILKNYKYIAPLPSFCKVNTNLPHSEIN